jgi:hypothetical protein
LPAGGHYTPAERIIIMNHFLYVTRSDYTFTLKEWMYLPEKRCWGWKRWVAKGCFYDRLSRVFSDWIKDTYGLLYAEEKGYSYMVDALLVHNIRVFDDWTDYRNSNVLTTIFVLDESSGL